MGQNVKHRTLTRRRRAAYRRAVPASLLSQQDSPVTYSAAHAATLSHIYECQYLHRIFTANMPYYCTRVKLSRLRDYMPRSWVDARNHNLLTRLTAKGLVLLRTRYATKPKNPE